MRLLFLEVRMIRLTRKVFTDLSIWMIGLGLLIGIIFPFFVSWMGIPRTFVLTPWFFAACITAGIIVGALNITLARVVVGRRLRTLADRMRHVTQKFRQIKEGGDTKECNTEECKVDEDSEDEIGQSALAFNTLVETLFESIETEESLERFTRMLGSQLSVGELTEKALTQLILLTSCAAGAVVVEKEGEMVVTTSQGIQDVDTVLESDHVRSVYRTESRRIISLPDVVRVEGVLTTFRPREVILEPIRYKEVMLGLIILASPGRFTQNAQDRLSLFTQSLALALHNSMLFDRLERLAALDPLTGIYNRRFGMTRLHEEFGRTLRMEVPLGVVMFDLDHFKEVNDVYGHLTGDRVLVRLANAARGVMREGDILVRYGGEEFLAILPGASGKDTFAIADRLCRKVRQTNVAYGEDLIKVTVSVGGVSYPETNVGSETELVERADLALYQAKESGRDCVVMANAG
jgi:two-component system, cell cycle response regulator